MVKGRKSPPKLAEKIGEKLKVSLAEVAREVGGCQSSQVWLSQVWLFLSKLREVCWFKESKVSIELSFFTFFPVRKKRGKRKKIFFDFVRILFTSDSYYDFTTKVFAFHLHPWYT